MKYEYNELLSKFIKYKYILYCEYYRLTCFDYAQRDTLQNLFNSLDKNLIDRLNKDADAKVHKKVMLKRRIEFMIQSTQCYFITLTFNDESFKKFKNEDRIRIAIQKYLKSLKCFYVGNADYGGQNGRLHYHAIVSEKPKKTDYKYGFMDIKKITYGTSSRISAYLLKLTNHAIKDTASKKMLLYSRGDYGFKKIGI